MHIECPSNNGRKTRATLFCAGCWFLAAWFARDGFSHYAQQNLDELNRIRGDATGEIKIDERVNSTLEGKSREELQKQLGQPPMQSASESRYFAIDGLLAVGNQPGSAARWSTLPHSARDIQVQKFLAIGMAAFGLLLTFNLLGIFKNKLILDDAGLHPKPGRTIAWDDMTALDSSKFAHKAWIDLKYNAGGKQKTFRLDSYLLANFNDLIHALCARKGFQNPLPDESAAEPPAETSA